MLLSKGIEVEQYTGLMSGQVLPLSALISQNLPEFTVEPDQRNVEFITDVHRSYDTLLSDLIEQRMRLRNFLKKQNSSWTVVPGSTLALPFEQNFIFSKPEDPYHRHINERHGLSVITTSLHFNVGIENPAELIRIVNLMRLECSLILALTACSPFYNGMVTGEQSYRWASFPKVPQFIPFFASQADFINWTNNMIEEGEMYNVRHFWGAVRPNGPKRPTDINRLEIRIADLSTSWDLVVAIMAWIEMRVQYFLRNPELQVSPQDADLVILSDNNEKDAALRGLSGLFSDWLYQAESSQYEAVVTRLEDQASLIEELGLQKVLAPISKVLEEGNEATQKLALVHDGHPIEEVMEEWTQESLEEDLRIEARCKTVS
jgi:predicted glutamate--cysteine ligase